MRTRLRNSWRILKLITNRSLPPKKNKNKTRRNWIMSSRRWVLIPAARPDHSRMLSRVEAKQVARSSNWVPLAVLSLLVRAEERIPLLSKSLWRNDPWFIRIKWRPFDPPVTTSETKREGLRINLRTEWTVLLLQWEVGEAAPLASLASAARPLRKYLVQQKVSRKWTRKRERTFRRVSSSYTVSKITYYRLHRSIYY